MNKDEYLKYETRKKLVSAFIEKLDVLKISDIDIIASLNHYVETGDESYFKEFCDFHFIKNQQQRQSMIDEAKETEKQVEDAKKRMEIYKKDFSQYLAEYRIWCSKVFESINDIELTGYLKLKDISKWADKFSKEMGNRDRAVYVIADNVLRPIENIMYSTKYNKVVVSLKNDESTVAPEKPLRPLYVNSFLKERDELIRCLDDI